MQFYHQNDEASYESLPEVLYPISDTTGMSRISPHHQSGGGMAGSMLMPGKSSYPSLFRSAAEIPSFSPTYRWWEDGATAVFWAFNSDEVQRCIRYGLYREPTLPRNALLSRPSVTVDLFLLSLIEPHERGLITNLSHVQKVEDVLRRCQINSPPRVPWSWFPMQRDRGLDPSAIAEAIDAESHLHFTRISFEEIVRYSLSYPVPSVEWFFQQHSALYIHLLNYFHAFPEEVVRYSEVEKHLRTRSPFAHRALLGCLRTMQNGGVQEPPLEPIKPGFGFIAGPIQCLFKDHTPNLDSVLRVLSVLKVRFQRTYLHVREMTWSREFDVSYNFLEDITDSTSPDEFARDITSLDKRHFSDLTQQGLIDGDVLTTELLNQWERLSIEVWECCTGLPGEIGKIQECAKATFHLSNYHSFTAILNGLQKYSITDSTFTTGSSAAGTVALNPVLPEDLLYLLGPDQNFAAYRQQFQASPGLPFLFPHIHEYEQLGPPALQQLFQLMRTSVR